MVDELKVLRNLVEQLMAEIKIIKNNQNNYSKVFNDLHKRLEEVERKC